MNDFSIGQNLSDYLLVVEPHEALKQSIQQIKQHFADQYECPAARFGKAQITLLSFKQVAMAETRWIPRLQRIITATEPFLVELEDFGNFPTHTIFIQVKTKNQLVALVKSLKPIQSMIKPDNTNKPHFITDPNLSIARKLAHWQFEQGWREFGNSQFSGKFIADHVLLMRKRPEEKKFEIIGRFKMEGVKHTVEQMQLFG